MWTIYHYTFKGYIVVQQKQTCVAFLLLFDWRQVLDVSYATTVDTKSSLVIWVLWKARCKCVFQKVKQNVVELVKEIWLMLLHTLTCQCEAISGEPHVVFRKQQHFREMRTKEEIFSSFRERIKWRYSPPRWLIPPSHYERILILDV